MNILYRILLSSVASFTGVIGKTVADKALSKKREPKWPDYIVDHGYRRNEFSSPKGDKNDKL